MPFDGNPPHSKELMTIGNARCAFATHAARILGMMGEKFEAGEWIWIQDEIGTPDTGLCLRGAAWHSDSARACYAAHYLAHAIRGRRARSLDVACQIIEHYNDAEGRKFPRILRLIEKAKKMAEGTRGHLRCFCGAVGADHARNRDCDSDSPASRPPKLMAALKRGDVLIHSAVDRLSRDTTGYLGTRPAISGHDRVARDTTEWQNR